MAQRLLVRDLMTVGAATCSPNTPMSDVARLVLDRGLEGVVVLDQDGNGIGVVSQDELVQAYTRDDWGNLTAEAIMREGVPQVPPDIPLTAAAQLMQDQGVRVVFLMHHANGVIYPAAVLSYRHLLRHIAAHSDADLQDLGIAAARKPPLEQFTERRDAARRQNRSSSQE
jgi:YD repeat-containing protein